MITPLTGKVLDALYGFCSVLRGLNDNVQPALNLFRIAGRPQEQLGSSQNACERVIEIMSDTGCQLAQG